MNIAINDGFVNLVFSEIDVFHSFICEGVSPGDAGFVVVVYRDLVDSVIHAKVPGAVFEMKKLLGAFVHGKDFSFAGALGSLVLSDSAPGNMTAVATDKVTGE